MKRALLSGLALVLASGSAICQDKAPVVLSGTNLEQSVHCDKGPIHITANDSHISVLGPCTTVRVEGSRNWIVVQHARQIVTAGDRNTVLYDDRSTQVWDKGQANSVMERWPQ